MVFVDKPHFAARARFLALIPVGRDERVTEDFPSFA
jgi:hypothetical protein